MMRPRVVLGLLLVTVIAGVITGIMLLPDDAPGIAGGPPAGDRPNPLGSRETTSTSKPVTTTSEPSRGATRVTNADSLLRDCLSEVDPPAVGGLLPISADGKVSGLGPGAHYVLNVCSALPHPGTGHKVAMEGGCSVAQSWLPMLVELAARVRRKLPDELGPNPPGIRDTVFQASFRMSPSEYLGIAADGASGVITGGYSVGGDGSRGSGQEWPIGGGDQFLRYELEFGVPVAEISDVVYVPVILTAEWTGESTENWTGEKAFGKVTVRCDYLLGTE